MNVRAIVVLYESGHADILQRIRYAHVDHRVDHILHLQEHEVNPPLTYAIAVELFNATFMRRCTVESDSLLFLNASHLTEQTLTWRVSVAHVSCV